MEFGDLLSQSRWQILETIALKPSSPVEISKKIGTSVAYVSQQLKILDVAGIVVKKRTRASDKGQPRLLYSLAKNFFYMVSLMNKNPVKKEFSPDRHQLAVLKIWMLDRKDSHHNIEKLYWSLEPFIEDVKGIYVDSSKKKTGVYVVSDKKDVKQAVTNYLKDVKGEIICEVVKGSDSNKLDKENLNEVYLEVAEDES